MAYEESRARFRESLDVMRLAWTQERFSSTGTFDTFRDMALIPKPSQHPHPPLHHAATSRETFAAIGTLGCPLLVGLASAAMAELAEGIAAYQAAWQEAGHPGQGEVRLRLPIYGAEAHGPGPVGAPGQCHGLLRARATSLPLERPDVRKPCADGTGRATCDSHLCGRVAH